MSGFRRFAALCLLAGALAGCGDVELYGRLTEREANAMLAVLLSHGIEARKVAARDNLVALHVEDGQVAPAIELLRAQGLPRERFDSMGDLFKKEGLISSPAEERIRFIYGLSQELSDTLSTIDGVLSARVHVVLPNNDPSAAAVKPSTAAVLIRHRAEADLQSLVPQIKQLVGNSIEGLQYERVSVVLFPAALPDVAAAAPRMTRVLSLGMARDSVAAFWAIIGVLVLLLAGAAGGAAWLYTAWRRERADATGHAD